MIQPIHYEILADAATEFLALAKQYHFCEELLPTIERKLYEESPFRGMGEAKDRAKEHKRG